jgi:quercetin dioxygenase-like cupin family protein
LKIFRAADIYMEPDEVPPHFDGVARLTQLPGLVPGPDKLATVVHRNGSQTAWHRHPDGQVIVVLSGMGRITLDGHETDLLEVGDVVVAEPNERHRHGAAQGRDCVFVAYFGGLTVWEEQSPIAPVHERDKD